ncbi:hypothetical protein GLAREA_07520 [Glarea lozoyensis ATCC 20868]|uniref:Uncharacterized protein n=1 Tax=Glarea lozoyensis (strain ATCC 20868 / MF5171) TaxID=1116229 RepID=S3D1H6_GLAL2|nr:uncharacterized protein GLAREA_07520 [Glarea lozoyensis ATCC 20868]EPE32387.1 hypothetical protein GLAREA_07520 [Glarea lozoyensis ATCC 20868]
MQQWSSQEGCHQRILALVFWCERGKIRQGRMHDSLKARCMLRGHRTVAANQQPPPGNVMWEEPNGQIEEQTTTAVENNEEDPKVTNWLERKHLDRQQELRAGSGRLAKGAWPVRAPAATLLTGDGRKSSIKYSKSERSRLRGMNSN